MVSSVPVLLIVFNRVDTARQVLAVLRQIKPARLYVAADAPRRNKSEALECAAARSLVNEVDWPCQVETLFFEENLGPRLAVSRAITWFFACEEEGIILEHDCLPDPSFFVFCQELLAKYRHQPQVMHISGNCFYPELAGEHSYYFSRLPHIWGWATWRRAWELYDVDMLDYPEQRQRGLLRKSFARLRERVMWRFLLDQVYYQRSVTWDFQWSYALLKHQGLAITPRLNLVSNIGFGANSLHSQDLKSPWAQMAKYHLDWPLSHPIGFTVNELADEAVNRRNFGFNWFKFLVVAARLDPVALRLKKFFGL